MTATSLNPSLRQVLCRRASGHSFNVLFLCSVPPLKECFFRNRASDSFKSNLGNDEKVLAATLSYEASFAAGLMNCSS